MKQFHKRSPTPAVAKKPEMQKVSRAEAVSVANIAAEPGLHVARWAMIVALCACFMGCTALIRTFL